MYFYAFKPYRTKTNFKKTNQPKFCKIFSLNFFGSIIGHSGICVGSLFFLLSQLPKIDNHNSNDHHNEQDIHEQEEEYSDKLGAYNTVN